MMQHSDILQACLDDIERGVPLEDVLNALPAEALDLAPLVRLAVATRNIPHPVLRPEIVQVQQAQVEHTARSVRAAHDMRATRPASSRSAWWEWLKAPRNSLVFAGGFALVLVVVAVAIGINMLFNSGMVASMANVSGLVEVESSFDSNDWHFVSAGEPLQAGQHIRTYADSTVTLAYYEGSRTLLGPNSDLVVSELDRGSGDVLQVFLSQNAGITTNVVVPLQGKDSFFNIDTPSGLAVVHGTSFEVDVVSGSEVLFAVTHGKVQVKNDLSEVFLLSGQATSAVQGADIEQPGYQFNLTGKVDSIDTVLSQWTVNGVTFNVTPETDVLGSYQVGDSVRVKGRILETGEWVADRIEPPPNDKQKASFTGVVETKTEGPGTWIISGHEVIVSEETELSDGIIVGSPVEVSFIVQDDGKWLAKEIELLEDNKPEPTATPTTTFTPTATFTNTPTGLETPTETPTTTFTPTPTVTGTVPTDTPTATMTVTATVMPKNETSRCDDRTNIQPEGLRLSERYYVSYEEIMGWFCQGFGFGEIDLAYELSQGSKIPVSEIFRMRSSGEGWGNIKKAIAPKITPGPAKNNGKPAPQAVKTPKPKK